MVGLDTFHGFSQLGLRVLDDVTFVENTIVPLDSLQIVDVVANNLIRGYHNVILGQLGKQTVAVAGVSSIHDRAQIFCVLENLIIPVTGQGRRADNQ